MTKIYHYGTLKLLNTHIRTALGVVLKVICKRSKYNFHSLGLPIHHSKIFFQSYLGQVIDREGSKLERYKGAPTVMLRQLRSPACLKIIASRLSDPLTQDFLVGESRLNRRLTLLGKYWVR